MPASMPPPSTVPLDKAASLTLDGLNKSYGEVHAVNDVNLTIGREETLALLGPSGCGKSTLLRLVAGLERPDSGRLLLNGVDVTRRQPQRRGVGMVFQSYALFPHLNVAGNVAFGLVEAGMPSEARHRRVAELLELVGLVGLDNRAVDRLSGGQQQRVALARALATQPNLLLLDEPLSDLDQALRHSLKEELRLILGRVGTSAIYVTHDQTEAFTLADRVALMRAGRIVQVGGSEELLERPRNAWVARFLGHDNVYEGAGLNALPLTTGRGDEVLLRADQTQLLPVDRVDVDPGPNSSAASGAPAQTEPVGATLESVTTVVEVREAVREGLSWRIELSAPAWGVGVVWRGFDRELTAYPTAGQAWHLRVPSGAWHVMRGDADGA